MGTTIRVNRTQTLWAWISGMFAFFTNIALHRPRFSLVRDDPSALHYAASKYNGKTD